MNFTGLLVVEVMCGEKTASHIVRIVGKRSSRKEIEMPVERKAWACKWGFSMTVITGHWRVA